MPLGLVGLFVLHVWIFGLLFIFGLVWTVVSWARTETRIAPPTSPLAPADDVRRADDEDSSPIFGDAVPKSGGLGDL